MADTCYDLIVGEAVPTADLRRTNLVIIFKKGDASLPKNYKPIAILLVMCKVCSSILMTCFRCQFGAQRTPEEIG